MLAAPLAHSQEELGAVSRETATAPATPPIARILGEIPDGTPPPPQPPKPKFVVPSKAILETTTHQQGGRQITVRKIKPIALPPTPAPVEPSTTVELDPEFKQRLAEYSEAHPRSELLFIGATVFRSKDSPPRTLVRYWPHGKGNGITFWSSADFALIAGGITSFADSAGDIYHLLMGWGNVDIDRMNKRLTAIGREYDAPEIPDFPDGKATFEIVGKPLAEEDLVPIQSLHDLYNNEHDRLKTASEGRERARLQHEAELIANPPKPKDIVLNYWRTETPAAPEKGAAR